MQFRRMNYAFWEYQPLDGGTNLTPKFFNRPNQTNSLNHVWTISPTMVNEFLATVSLDDVYIPVDQANFLDRTKVGINYPYIFPQGKLIPTRIPTVNMTELLQLNGGPYPSHSAGPIYDISDSFTWVKGSHTLKFGLLYEKSGENDNDEINVSACPTCTNNQNGQFSFTDARVGGRTSGVAAANAALGLFDTYSELGQRAYTIFRGSMWEGFAGDSWKATPEAARRLRRSLLRDRSLPRAVGEHGRFRSRSSTTPPRRSQVDTGDGRTIIPGSGDRYNGMVIPGTGWPVFGERPLPRSQRSVTQLPVPRRATSHFSDIQWNDFQPRVGIAYSINDKTVSAPAPAASSPAWASATPSSWAATRRSSPPPTSPSATWTTPAEPPPTRCP